LSQEAGDTWLLCSDGVHGFLNDDAIAEALSAATPDAAADRIVRGAVNGGGTDNATAVVLRFV
jgi:protein phosphatase